MDGIMDNLGSENPAVEPGNSIADNSMAESLRRSIAIDNGEDPDAGTEPEQEAAEPEQPEQEPEAEAKAEAEPEFADIEIDGETFKVPAKLKDGYLRQSDYSRKTAEVAREKEATTQIRAAAEQAFAVAQQLGPALAEYSSAFKKAEYYNSIDWNRFHDADPIECAKQRDDARDNLDNLRNLTGYLQQAPQALSTVQQQAHVAETQRNLPLLKELVPDFATRKDELIATGREYGFSDQELLSTPDARHMRVLRDLAEYKKLTADRGKVMQTIKNAPPVAKPGGRNVGPAASTKDYSAAVRALKTDSSDDAFTNALRMQRKLKG